MKTGFILLSAVALSGCTNMLNFRPTMEADTPLLGVEGIALATDLSRAYRPLNPEDQIVCRNLQLGYQEREADHLIKYGSARKGKIDEWQCVGFKPNPTSGEISNHVKAGYALSDYFCSIFFERIAEHSGKRKFARNVTNDVGAMVSTVLGLASVSGGVTGGVGAAFGLVDGTFRNYDENFLVSADLPTMLRLVKSEREKFRQETPMPDNYYDATNVIISYADLCSFVGMKGLLVKSMEGQTNKNNDKAGAVKTTEQKSEVELGRERAQKIAKEANPPKKTDETQDSGSESKYSEKKD